MDFTFGRSCVISDIQRHYSTTSILSSWSWTEESEISGSVIYNDIIILDVFELAGTMHCPPDKGRVSRHPALEVAIDDIRDLDFILLDS